MRTRKPWFHRGTGYWCVKIDGRQIYLDKDETKARRVFADLMAGNSRTVTAWLAKPLQSLVDECLADVKARRKPSTHRDYSQAIDRASRFISLRMPVGDVRKIHLSKIEQGLTRDGCGPTTIGKTLYALQRVFAWAVETELIERNPLTGYRRPRAKDRTRVISSAEFQAMLRKSDPPFRRFLIALRLTGCRPGELRGLLWEHVDLEAGVWILPDHKTVTRQRKPRPRIIAMTGPVLKLCRWLAAHYRVLSTGYVFLNAHGKPWTVTALLSRMRRLRVRAGLVKIGGENIVSYSCRHTMATEACGKVSDKELAELLGHVDTRMLGRYVHLQKDRLRDIARRAAGQ
jgi:integrase